MGHSMKMQNGVNTWFSDGWDTGGTVKGQGSSTKMGVGTLLPHTTVGECPTPALEDLISIVWGGIDRLKTYVSQRSQSKIEHQKKRVEKLPEGAAKEKAVNSLNRGWLALDAEARGRGNKPEINAWVGFHFESKIPVAISTEEIELENFPCFLPSELVQFVPESLLLAKGAFSGRIENHKIISEFPFDDEIPF